MKIPIAWILIIGLAVVQARPFGFKPPVFDNLWDKWQTFQSVLTFVQALATLANLSSSTSITTQPPQMFNFKTGLSLSNDVKSTSTSTTVVPSAPESIPIPIPNDQNENSSRMMTSNHEPVPLSSYGLYLDPVDGMLPTPTASQSTGNIYQSSSSNGQVLDADVLNRLTQFLYQEEVDTNQSRQNKIVGVNFEAPVASLSYKDEAIPSQTQNVQSQGYYYANGNSNFVENY